MSDEDDFLSEESYEFEFQDDDDGSVHDVSADQDSAENQYYSAKRVKEDSLEEAARRFRQLVEAADSADDTEWVFKSYKQLAKIHYQQSQYGEVLRCFRQLIDMLSRLNGNYAEQSISKILSKYSASANKPFVQNMYDVIVTQLQDSMVSGVTGNRLWLRINLNRMQNMLENGDTARCFGLIRSIGERLATVSESTRNLYALDVLAAEIECTMCAAPALDKLSDLYLRSKRMSPAIIHPRVMGVVKECSATVQFFRHNYDTARVDFYECFKHYDEAGAPAKKRVLKYLTLCSLLIESEANPFESQETQSYARLDEYQNLLALLRAYEQRRLDDFLAVAARIDATGDPLAADWIYREAHAQILHNLKIKVLLGYIQAYRTVRFDFVRAKLHLPSDAALEQLLLVMANSGTGPAVHIDFRARVIAAGPAARPLFAPSLDAASVETNLCSLYRLAYKGPWGDDDDRMAVDRPDRRSRFDPAYLPADNWRAERAAPGVHELLFGARARSPECAVDQQEWYKYLVSAIPPRRAQSRSQKDKVVSEQQEDVEQAASHEADEANASTKSGLLGTSMQPGHVPDAPPAPAASKTELLQKWTHQLLRSFAEELQPQP